MTYDEIIIFIDSAFAVIDAMMRIGQPLNLNVITSAKRSLSFINTHSHEDVIQTCKGIDRLGNIFNTIDGIIQFPHPLA